MDYLPPILIALFFAILFFSQYWASRQGKRHRGGQLPQVVEQALGENRPTRALVYFHSPTCGPCVQMGPMVDRLGAAHPGHVFKFDVTQHFALATALGVRGTPTTVMINDTTVADIIVGSTSERKLKKLFEQ